MTTDEQIAAFLATSPAVAGLDDGPRGLSPAVDDGEASRARSTARCRRHHRQRRLSQRLCLDPDPDRRNSTLGLAYSQTDHGNNAVFRPYDE
jgi:hypothetical protein